MKIVAISDTHNKHKKIVVPECDLLIHAGDWSFHGYKEEVERYAEWLNEQTQCKEIVTIPGNHEKELERFMPDSLKWFTDKCPRAHLLIDSGVELFGVKIWGSPVQPFFCNWAWNRAPSEKDELMVVDYSRGKLKLVKSIKPHWDMIPEDTQVLITHGPPQGILDKTTYASGDENPNPLGCPILLKRVKELKKLDLHFFGHIHNPGGRQHHEDGVSFYNASVCDEMYCPTNPITVVEYEPEPDQEVVDKDQEVDKKDA